jgi:hypothetical protein
MGECAIGYTMDRQARGAANRVAPRFVLVCVESTHEPGPLRERAVCVALAPDLTDDDLGTAAVLYYAGCPYVGARIAIR